MTSLATDLSDGVRLIQVSTGVLPSFPSVSLKGCSKNLLWRDWVKKELISLGCSCSS